MKALSPEVRCSCGHAYSQHEWNGHACGSGGCHCAEFDRDTFVDVVFDGPPAHESGRFVEVEDEAGASVNVGEWIDRGDGYWALRIRVRPS